MRIPAFPSGFLRSWAAACALAALALVPYAAEAQSNGNKSRAGTPQKAVRGPAKAAIAAPAVWAPNPGVTSRDAFLAIDAGTGRDLASDRPDELRHPASLTKLMTLYMTFSALDSGRLSPGQSLPVSLAAVNVQPTKMGAALGGTLSVRDAAMGLITRSANDAAVVLAEALAGSEEEFARAMTQRARQLGMLQTTFRNASGLPHREQVTTARDMARLGQALLRDFPHYYALFSTQTYLYRGRPLENHNRMLQTYPGADGMKTGYTMASGFNLVMSASRDGRRVIGVVMGGDSASLRDRDMAVLMDRGFAAAQAQSLPAWSAPRPPATARYSAVNFAPGMPLPKTDPPARSIVRAEPPAAPAPPASATAAAPHDPAAPTPGSGPRVAAAAPAPPAPGPAPAQLGGWVIQIGSFNDSRTAEVALERASGSLPSLAGKAAPTIDEIQLAGKSFHRARLANLSQDEALDGCKRLEQRKIFCAALQVTAWNTAGAR